MTHLVIVTAPDLTTPIVNARVTCEGVTATTDASGHATVVLPDLVHGVGRLTSLSVSADGYVPSVSPVEVLAQEVLAVVALEPAVATPTTPTRPLRTGVVTIATPRVAQDDQGPFHPLGTTLFSALWLFLHDRPRLDHELATIRDAQVFDVIRVLGCVEGPSWEDRTVTPNEPGYLDAVRDLTAYVAPYGLRIEWTIFGGIPASHQALNDRIWFVQQFAKALHDRQAQVFAIEIANEGYDNGFSNTELRTHAANVLAILSVPVAPSTPSQDEADICALYAGLDVPIATCHYDRDTSGAGGAWRPVRKPWEWPDTTKCAGQSVVQAVVNNEPIGPWSSVAQDRDPLRLVLAYATAMVCGNTAHVFHTGPGIRSGGQYDVPRGIPATLDGIPEWATITAGFREVQTLLPVGLQNWARHNGHWASNPFDFGGTAPFDAGALVRAYTATNGSIHVCTPLGVMRDVVVRPRSAMHVMVVDVLSGALIYDQRHAAGDAFTLTCRRAPSDGDGYLLLGVNG